MGKHTVFFLVCVYFGISFNFCRGLQHHNSLDGTGKVLRQRKVHSLDFAIVKT